MLATPLLVSSQTLATTVLPVPASLDAKLPSASVASASPGTTPDKLAVTVAAVLPS